jgi:hypothetical protein
MMDAMRRSGLAPAPLLLALSLIVNALLAGWIAWDRSERAAGGAGEPPPVARAAASPADPAACTARLAVAEAQLTVLRRDLEEGLTPEQRFERAPTERPRESSLHLLGEAPDTVFPELRRRVRAFRQSTALSDCTDGFRRQGELDLTIRYTEAGLTLIPAGSLAGSGAARCLEDRLRLALAGLPPASAREPTQVGLRLASPPP